MTRNFYFGSDTAMARGSAAFSAAINSDPLAFGLSVEQAASFAEIDATLQDAFVTAITPSTRTAVAIAHKNTVIKQMQTAARLLAVTIRANPAVTDAQLIALGLLPRSTRTRRTVPQTPPLIRVVSNRGRVVNLRIIDAEHPVGRRKPFAAVGAQLFVYVGEELPTHADQYEYKGMTSKTSMQITLPDRIPSGATIWLSARWLSARGETSISSTPTSTTIQGGTVTAAAPMMLRAAA